MRPLVRCLPSLPRRSFSIQMMFPGMEFACDTGTTTMAFMAHPFEHFRNSAFWLERSKRCDL